MRPFTWGTPGRTEHYLSPRGKFAFVYPALAIGGLILAVLVLLQAFGLRKPVAPGEVISQHAAMENRCQECHTTGSGVSNLRCQRCHDPSGAGRLTNGAHVLFGSRDLKKAAAAPDLPCAGCHVEHRGRKAKLTLIDQTQCAQCHFRSFPGHPEFAVLRAKSIEIPGLKFTHDRHVQEVVKKLGGAPRDSCVRCHEPTPGGRDLDPISFDRHCAECHSKEGSLGTVDPITEEDVLSPQAVLALGMKADWLQRSAEFESSRGKVSKTFVRHKDEWVLYNLSKLRRELEPEGFAAERGALLARLSQLRRRLALSAPLAELDQEALKRRQAALEMELTGLDARIKAQEKAADPAAGLARLEEVRVAAAIVNDASAVTEAQQLKSASEVLRGSPAPPVALPPGDFEARRQELLTALDAAVTVDPALKPRAEDLRRRLLALTPGESGLEILTRVREQRAANLERVRDESRLREAGTVPPPAFLLVAPQRALEEALQETQARLDQISQGPPAKGAPVNEEKQRKKESLESLTGPCVKCHVFPQASLARVVAARRVMVRARFVHEPHLLQARCEKCHPGVERSKASQDINFKGVDSCRECHRPRGVRQDCQTCHLYHAPAVP